MHETVFTQKYPFSQHAVIGSRCMSMQTERLQINSPCIKSSLCCEHQAWLMCEKISFLFFRVWRRGFWG